MSFSFIVFGSDSFVLYTFQALKIVEPVFIYEQYCFIAVINISPYCS